MATTMTEIPIKDLALTTAPAGKQLLVRDASAGLQRIDYDQIAKNLVESYGSSSLAGKNQSIKAAIDSLNSGLTQCNTNITTINNSLSNITTMDEIHFSKSFKNLKAGESVETESHTIDKTGWYLCCLGIQHCGGSGSNVGAQQSAFAIDSSGNNITSIRPMYIYGGIIIPMCQLQDAAVYQTCLIQLFKGNSVHFKFYNNTGKDTDNVYYSSVHGSLVWLKN